ncbi:MAG: HAD hydrolase-like protein [Candidatus Moraniibacteriota bacterium]
MLTALGKVKHIGLDFDGVIVNSNFKFASEFTTIGKNLTGRDVSFETVFSIWGKTIHELLLDLYPEIDLVEYLEERKKLGFDQVFPDIFPGVVESLKILSKKFYISIITNREYLTLFEIIEKLDIDIDLFEHIQSSDETPFSKPDPRVFDDFLVAYRAQEMIYIGDHHLVDYQAAYGAGIHFIGVLSGGISTREDFIGAGVPRKMILNSLADVPNHLGISA